MTKSNDALMGVGTKAYLFIWSVSLLLPLLDGTIFGNGAGGLDARPLVEEDHRYLFPVIYCLLGSLFVNTSPRVTSSLACLAHAIDLAIRWQRMPTVWDHEQWAVQIELTFLLVFLPTCVTLLDYTLASAEQAFCFIARCQFVLFYAAATFWKFNSSFLDTNVSCGTVLILETLSTYLPKAFLSPPVTVALGKVSPHLTALVEGAIATTMACKPLRHVAVVLATVFHLTIFLLPVNAAGGFSLDCTTRFIVFFTSAELQHYTSHMSLIKEGIVAVLVSAALVLLRYNCTGAPFDFGFMGMSLLTAFYLRVVSANVSRKVESGHTSPHTKSLCSWYHVFVFAGVLLLTVTYGFLTVILGLQHMGAPTMYSNLRYYGGGNHYLVPVSILSDDLIYDGGLVQIVESTSVALNRRLAYIPSEVVFPPTALEKIRLATNQTSLPVQFFPLCISNPHSRQLLAGDYEPYNPVGSTNFMPFILPISDLRKALGEEPQDESFVIKLVDAGTSDNLQETVGSPERVAVLTKQGCEIQSADGKRVDDCANDRAARLITRPRAKRGWMKWLVSKLQTPYPQLVGLKEEICMS